MSGNLACIVGLLAAGHLTPAALEVLTPDVVRVAHGIAMRQGDDFVFVCPRLWGGPDSPDAAFGDGRLWVAGADGVRSVRIDAADEAVLDADGVREVLTVDGRAYAFTSRGPTTALHRVEPGAPVVWTSTLSWDDVAADGPRFALARRADAAIHVLRVDPMGNDLSLEVVPTTGDRVSLRPPYVVVRDGNRYTLIDGLAAPIHVSAEPILGPVDSFFVAEGRLYEILQRSARALDVGRNLTCIGRAEDVYVCAQLEIYDVRPDGTLGDLRFDLQAVAPPLTPLCNAEWLDLMAEARIPERSVGPEVDHESSRADCDCSTGGREKDGRFMTLILVWGVGALLRGRR